MNMLTRRLMLGALAAAPLLTPTPARAAPNFAAAARYSAERRGVSLLVVERGQVVFEDYPNEGGAERGWELASGTKSFCGIMAAAAAHDRLLDIDERCADTLPEWRSDARKARVTIRQLLTLTSGLASGSIGRPPPFDQAVASPIQAEPGARFIYGPAPFQVFGAILQRKTGGDPLAYLQRRVFDPLNIRPQRWRRTPNGDPHLPSGAALTARDWARFGHFAMRANQGHDDGPPLDRATLADCFEGTRANPGYGLTWWLLRPGLVPPSPRSGVDTSGVSARADVRMAAGAGDQRLYLVPERNLVIARQATGILQAMRGRRRGAAWSDREFLELLLA